MAIISQEAQNWYADHEKAETIPDGYELNDKYNSVWYGKCVDPPQDKYDADTKNGKTQGAWFEAIKCD